MSENKLRWWTPDDEQRRVEARDAAGVTAEDEARWLAEPDFLPDPHSQSGVSDKEALERMSDQRLAEFVDAMPITAARWSDAKNLRMVFGECLNALIAERQYAATLHSEIERGEAALRQACARIRENAWQDGCDSACCPVYYIDGRSILPSGEHPQGCKDGHEHEFYGDANECGKQDAACIESMAQYFLAQADKERATLKDSQ